MRKGYTALFFWIFFANPAKRMRMATSDWTNLGQLFMVALEGEKITMDEARLIQEMQPAGITLFARNLRNLDQICTLNQRLIDLCDIHPIIAIDQEGGSKERLPSPPFTHWPKHRYLTEDYLRSSSDRLTRAQHVAIAKELTSLGINMNFAPVLDIGGTHEPSFIDDRAFGNTPKIVSELGVAAMQALQEGGVIPCGKHFPGHGGTSTDSHLSLPRIDKSETLFTHHELAPFQAAIEADCPMIMTAHIIYAALDADQPATLSKSILTGLLRRQMGFKGLIVTDDMNMMAIQSHFGAFPALTQSLKAGANLMLYCKEVDAPFRLYHELLERLNEGSDQELCQVVRNHIEQIAAWKARYLQNPPMPSKEAASDLVSKRDHRQLAQQIQNG